MTIESGLYHPGHYDRGPPVGSYWEMVGGPSLPVSSRCAATPKAMSR